MFVVGAGQLLGESVFSRQPVRQLPSLPLEFKNLELAKKVNKDTQLADPSLV